MSACTQLLGQFVQAHDRAAEALGEAERAVGVAVGDEDRPRALARPARARSARSSRRRRGSRRGGAAGPPSTLSARSTATEGTLTRLEPIAVSERTRLPVVSAAANRRLVSGPVLPARIAASWARLTWPWISASPTIIDSRPDGDPVELAGGVAVARRVDRLGQLGRADLRAAGQQPEHVGLGPDGVADDEVDLGAVAGRDHDRLAHLARWRVACARELAASPSVKASRSRRATGAVLCEMPSASSSLMRRSTPASRERAVAAVSLGGVGGLLDSSSSSPRSRSMRLRRIAMIAT